MAAVQPGAEDPAALKAIARHAEAIATVRMFLSRSEALRVVLLLDLGDGDPPAMLDARPGVVHVHFLPAIDTSGWRVEQVPVNRDRVREMFTGWHAELHAS